MNKTKFTVRVDPEAMKTAKEYARQHGTTVTNLVEEYFRSLSKVEEISHETPILQELAGSLNQNASIEDYQDYLEKKYLDSGQKNG